MVEKKVLSILILNLHHPLALTSPFVRNLVELCKYRDSTTFGNGLISLRRRKTLLTTLRSYIISINFQSMVASISLDDNTDHLPGQVSILRNKNYQQRPI
jgi:hypothetical protein